MVLDEDEDFHEFSTAASFSSCYWSGKLNSKMIPKLKLWGRVLYTCMQGNIALYYLVVPVGR